VHDPGNVMPRYSLLRHTDAPDDPSGCHIDLLLEDGPACRTWRLPELPRLNGPAQDAIPLPAHRLVWLEPRSAAVSGNRGWAERIGAGLYRGDLPEQQDADVAVELSDGPLAGQLRIAAGLCAITSP
jgi:hypothetical protein